MQFQVEHPAIGRVQGEAVDHVSPYLGQGVQGVVADQPGVLVITVGRGYAHVELEGVSIPVRYPHDALRRVQPVIRRVGDGLSQSPVDPRAAEKQGRSTPFLLKDGIVRVAQDHPLVAACIPGVLRRFLAVRDLDVGNSPFVYAEEPGLFLLDLAPGHDVGEFDDGPSPSGNSHHNDHQNG